MVIIIPALPKGTETPISVPGSSPPTLPADAETPISASTQSFPNLPTGADGFPPSAPAQPSPMLSTGMQGLPLSAPTQTSSSRTLARRINLSKEFGFIPDELIGMIAEEIVGHTDFLSFHDAMQRSYVATMIAFGKRISRMTIYPCADQMLHILEALQNKHVSNAVHYITVLAEGLREHEYGYVWGWEDLQIWENLDYSRDDVRIINTINVDHANARDTQSEFIYSGQYRALLYAILKACHNLKRITVRKLEAGEQIPGWSGDKFKELSFYRDDLDTRNIFYGDWQYDTLHGRATQYQDEFGDVIMEPDAGPQASFIDDFRCAKRDSGCKAKVTYKAFRRR